MKNPQNQTQLDSQISKALLEVLIPTLEPEYAVEALLPCFPQKELAEALLPQFQYAFNWDEEIVKILNPEKVLEEHFIELIPEEILEEIVDGSLLEYIDVEKAFSRLIPLIGTLPRKF